MATFPSNAQPGQYLRTTDPSYAGVVPPHDREGCQLDPLQHRFAEVGTENEYIVDYGAAAAAATVTSAAILGGRVRVQNASGAANLVLPTAAAWKTATSSYTRDFSSVSKGIAAVVPGITAQGSETISVRFIVKNSSGQTITITQSSDATITVGTASAAAARMGVLTGTCGIFEIYSIASTTGVVSFFCDRLA